MAISIGILEFCKTVWGLERNSIDYFHQQGGGGNSWCLNSMRPRRDRVALSQDNWYFCNKDLMSWAVFFLKFWQKVFKKRAEKNPSKTVQKKSGLNHGLFACLRLGRGCSFHRNGFLLTFFITAIISVCASFHFFKDKPWETEMRTVNRALPTRHPMHSRMSFSFPCP